MGIKEIYKMHLIRKRKANMMDDIFDQIFLREKIFCP